MINKILSSYTLYPKSSLSAKTNQPRGQISRQGQFSPKNGQNAYFGAKMAFFWPNILIGLGGSKTFSIPLPYKHLVCIFWSGLSPNRPEIPILDPICRFGVICDFFVPIFFCGGVSETFCNPMSEKQ